MHLDVVSSVANYDAEETLKECFAGKVQHSWFTRHVPCQITLFGYLLNDKMHFIWVLSEQYSAF